MYSLKWKCSGLKDATTNFHPQMSKTFSGKVWKHISSGQHHTIALDDEGQVFVLGRKEYGRLGLGTNCTDAKELTLVPSLSSAKCVDVAAGSAQSFAVTESGNVMCSCAIKYDVCSEVIKPRYAIGVYTSRIMSFKLMCICNCIR